MTYLLDGIYAIPVPDDAHTFSFDEEGNLIYRAVFAGHSNVGRLVRLPPGSYKILFTTKKCSREQAKSVVDGTVIYELMDVSDYNVVLNHLLSQRNLDPEKNYILIKREI